MVFTSALVYIASHLQDETAEQQPLFQAHAGNEMVFGPCQDSVDLRL
jgi:hypothetical protein